METRQPVFASSLSKEITSVNSVGQDAATPMDNDDYNIMSDSISEAQLMDSMQSLKRYLYAPDYAAGMATLGSTMEPPSPCDDDQMLAPIQFLNADWCFGGCDDGDLNSPFHLQKDSSMMYTGGSDHEGRLDADSLTGFINEFGSDSPAHGDKEEWMDTQFAKNVDEDASIVEKIAQEAKAGTAAKNKGSLMAQNKEENGGGCNARLKSGGDARQKSSVWPFIASKGEGKASRMVTKQKGHYQRMIRGGESSIKSCADKLSVWSKCQRCHDDDDDDDDSEDEQEGSKRTMGRQPKKSKSLESERKRRQKLNERLFALRALVPKISKMDKASIVVDAINYVRDLKKQIEDIEVDISHLEVYKDNIGNVTNKLSNSNHASKSIRHVASHHTSKSFKLVHWILELHVSQMEENLFQFRIRCKKTPGVVLQLARALEALDVNIVNGSVTSINNYILNTLVVEVDGGHNLHSEDLKERTLAIIASSIEKMVKGFEWGYVDELVAGKTTSRVRCKSCNHEFSGNAHRIKEHVFTIPANVLACTNPPRGIEKRFPKWALKVNAL